MSYVRKTKDRWDIETNYGYGWEVESSYDADDYENPCKSAYEDAKGYREAGAVARVVKRRERI